MTESVATLAGRSVVVTGASGFIGSHVVRRLVAEGAEVHAMVRHLGGARLADVRSAVTEVELDVTDAASVRGRIADARPEVVIHLAGDTSARRYSGEWDVVERSLAVNVHGTLNVVRATIECPSAQVLIRTGGLEEYGTAPTPYHESQREEPISPYSASQVAATHFTRALQPHTSVSLVTLRPALVYGPAQSTDFFIPALVESCLRGVDFAMSDGGQARDLLYVDDLVDAIVLAATNPPPGGALVNLGHGDEHRMVDVAREVVELVGSDAALQVGARPRRPGDLEHLVTTTDTAVALLGWRPAVALSDGLARTVEWYRAEMRTAAR